MLRFIPAVILAAWLVQPGFPAIQSGASPAQLPADALLSVARPAAQAADPTPAQRQTRAWPDPDLAWLKGVKAARAWVSPADAAEAPPAPESPSPAPEAPPLDGLEALVCSYPWPCEEALAVARCESGTDLAGRLDGAAASSGSSYGLFQINAVHAYRWPEFWDQWMDPARNTEWAFQLWSEQGWRPWSCRP